MSTGTPLPEATKKKIYKEWLATGMTTIALGKKYNLPSQTIGYIIDQKWIEEKGCKSHKY